MRNDNLGSPLKYLRKFFAVLCKCWAFIALKMINNMSYGLEQKILRISMYVEVGKSAYVF